MFVIEKSMLVGPKVTSRYGVSSPLEKLAAPQVVVPSPEPREVMYGVNVAPGMKSEVVVKPGVERI